MASILYKKGSVSFPSKTHSSIIKVEEELDKLKTWEISATSTSGSLGVALSSLESIYFSLEMVLGLRSVQHLLTSHGSFLDELLDESVRLIDACETSRHLLCRYKESLRSVESSLRRGRGDAAIVAHVLLRRTMRKEAKKMMMRLPKKAAGKMGECLAEDEEESFSTVARVLKEVEWANIRVFNSVLGLMSSSSSKWAVASNVGPGQNEFERVDALLKERLVENISFEKRIENLEHLLECVSRRLIRTRASILNILSR